MEDRCSRSTDTLEPRLERLFWAPFKARAEFLTSSHSGGQVHAVGGGGPPPGRSWEHTPPRRQARRGGRENSFLVHTYIHEAALLLLLLAGFWPCTWVFPIPRRWLGVADLRAAIAVDRPPPIRPPDSSAVGRPAWRVCERPSSVRTRLVGACEARPATSTVFCAARLHAAPDRISAGRMFVLFFL